MNAHERVLAACSFQRPDQVPRFDSFWEYPDTWQVRLGSPEALTDIAIWVPDETTFPTRARHLKEDGGWVYEVEGWGRTVRRRPDAYFVETLEVPLPEGADPDALQFDPPALDSRYLQGQPDLASTLEMLRQARRSHCLFGKTGGPYLRSTYIRGETQFLTDIAQDWPLAKAIADKVADLSPDDRRI